VACSERAAGSWSPRNWLTYRGRLPQEKIFLAKSASLPPAPKNWVPNAKPDPGVPLCPGQVSAFRAMAPGSDAVLFRKSADARCAADGCAGLSVRVGP